MANILLDNRSLLNQSLVSTADWIAGTIGTTVDFSEYKFSTNAYNQIVNDTGPFGTNIPMWQGGNTGQVSAHSGFNQSTNANFTKQVSPYKTYRFSMWVRVKTALSSGLFYFGWRTYTSTNTLTSLAGVTGAAASTNAYFVTSANASLGTLLPTGTWRLVVGYLRPTGYAGTTNDPTTGLWTTAGTNLGLGGGTGDRIMTEDTDNVMIRYLGPYNETGDGLVQVAYPRIEVIDGTEVSFQELLKGPNFKEVSLIKRIPSSLIAYWKLDETSGTTVYDSYGSYTGTFTDGQMSSDGKFGYCYYLNDSTTTGISFGNVLDFERTDSFTINAWLKRASSGVYDSIFSKLLGASAYTGYGFSIPASNKPTGYCIANYNTSALVVSASTTVTDNNWHMYTMTYDGSSSASGMQFYLDGTLLSKDTPVKNNLTSSMKTDTAVTARLASAENGEKGLNGYLDEVSIYNAVLSTTEISDLYARLRISLNA